MNPDDLKIGSLIQMSGSPSQPNTSYLITKKSGKYWMGRNTESGRMYQFSKEGILKYWELVQDGLDRILEKL